MALQLKISIASFNRVTKTATINDTTGTFNAISNPGGYGAPNPDRSSFALVITARRVIGQNETAHVESDAVTDATWNYVFTFGGSYEIFLVALPIETNPDVSSLAEGYIYWETVTQKIFLVKNGIAVETNSVIDGALHISVVTNHLVTAFSEERAIEIFCLTFLRGACLPLREEYNDLNRTLDAIQCYFQEAYFEKADELFTLANKIIITNPLEDTTT